MRWLWILVAWVALAQTPAEQQRASIKQQSQVARKQAEKLGVWLLPWSERPPVAEQADCDAIKDDVVTPMIEAAAKTQELDPKLVSAVIQQESGFRPCAVSPKGAQGLMQLMPETVTELAVRDPFDAKASIEGGTRYLKQLFDRYKGDLSQALAAYNAGPGAVDEAHGVPEIIETRSYVESILAKLGLKRTDPPKSPTPHPPEN